jgi:hypothetical protein
VSIDDTPSARSASYAAHHYLFGHPNRGQFIPCGLPLDAVAHRDAAKATCAVCLAFASALAERGLV